MESGSGQVELRDGDVQLGVQPAVDAAARRVIPRIMPIGDSITYGVTDGDSESGGYRTYLWQALTASGYRVNFVGSQANGPDSIDRNHAGYRGQTIQEIADSVNDQITRYKPDVILLLAGTNDVLQNRDLTHAPQRLSTWIDQILAASPNTTIGVATLPPNTKSDNNPQRIREFNAALTDLVTRKIRQGKSLKRVDLYSRLTPADLADQTHPTAEGYKKMAQSWYESLTDVLPLLKHTRASEQQGNPVIGTRFLFSGDTENQALRSSTLVGDPYDRLLNFNPQQGDRIQLDFDGTATQGQQERPTRLFNAGIQIEETLEQAVRTAYADVNFSRKDNQPLRPNQSVIFQYRDRFYLSVNNSSPAFQTRSDLFVDLGAAAKITDAGNSFHVGSLSVTQFFA